MSQVLNMQVQVQVQLYKYKYMLIKYKYEYQYSHVNHKIADQRSIKILFMDCYGRPIVWWHTVAT